MRYLLSFTLLAAALAGCSTAGKNEMPGPSALNTGLQAQQDRIIDSRILGDRKTIDTVQERLRKLNEAGVPQNNYSLAKAQCWLDTAKTQYHENDRTGYIEESLAESVRIVEALEVNKTAKAGLETPLVARSTRLRDDLWTQLGQFKNNQSTLACNARLVACAEVRLVRAGHAEEQTGWRAATPHVQMAEDAIRRAGLEAASCNPPAPAPVAGAPASPVVATPATVAPAPTPAPIAQTVTRETYVILADALFKFDKSGRDEMLPGGRERLAALAQRLKSYQSIATMRVVGHTDLFGSDAYNDPLSANRAATVQAYLESLGVRAAKAQAFGNGKREPVITSCTAKGTREEQIACQQPNRRVTIEVTGIVK